MSKPSQIAIAVAPYDDLPEGWALVTLPEAVGFSGVFADGDWVESKY